MRSRSGFYRAGYKTALIGKYLNRYGQESKWRLTRSAWAGNYLACDIRNPADWVPAGWDLWYAFTGSRARYYDYAINENGTILSFGHRRGHSTDARRALHRRRSSPSRSFS